LPDPAEQTNVIEVNGLRAEYGDKVILEDVSMDVRQGEIMVVVGGSGCGKSTLLKQIVGLLEPAAGTIRVLGKDLAGLGERELDVLHESMGMLFQNGALLGSATVEENVAIPLLLNTSLPESVVKKIVLKKLDMVGLAAALHKLPTELSGGMQKRAALARALALDPLILLADEPSAGLDPVTLKSLDKLLLDLREMLGMSLVVVTHEVSSILRIADRITFLADGRVIFAGTKEEIAGTTERRVADFFASATGVHA